MLLTTCDYDIGLLSYHIFTSIMHIAATEADAYDVSSKRELSKSSDSSLTDKVQNWTLAFEVI